MSRNQNISFLQEDLHGLNYRMLSEDLLKSYQYVSVYPYQLKQGLSTEPDKSLLNGSFGTLNDKNRLVFFIKVLEKELIFQLFLILAANAK